MKLKVLSRVSSPGNGTWNEDIIITKEGCLAVIDGATPINVYPFRGYNSTAEWMVGEFDEFLVKISQMECYDFRELCAAFIAKTSTIPEFINMKDYDKPCFTCAAVNLSRQYLQCFVLGDCCIYFNWIDGKITSLTDKRSEAFSQETKKVKYEAIAAGLNPEEAIRIQKQKNRSLMNKAGGYWAVGYAGDFTSEFKTQFIPHTDIKKILLCSDGFDRTFDIFDLVSIDSIFTEEISLENALEILRDYESEVDNQIKKTDDASALFIELITG